MFYPRWGRVALVAPPFRENDTTQGGTGVFTSAHRHPTTPGPHASLADVTKPDTATPPGRREPHAPGTCAPWIRLPSQRHW
jgi:hypothetical protein